MLLLFVLLAISVPCFHATRLPFLRERYKFQLQTIAMASKHFVQPPSLQYVKSSRSVSEEGLTMYSCKSDSDCKSPRFCQRTDGIKRGCSDYVACACIPPTYTECNKESDCPPGEECLGINVIPYVCRLRAGNPHLETKETVDAGESVLTPKCKKSRSSGSKRVDKKSEHYVSRNLVKANVLDMPFSAKQNGKSCTASDQAMCGDLPCYENSNDSVAFKCCDASSITCVCVRLAAPMCRSSKDCTDGEVCLRAAILPALCVDEEFARDVAYFQDGFKILSEESDDVLVKPEPTTEDNDDAIFNEVCIAVHELSPHFSMDELLFESHRKAAVLCDQFKSCATPGHIVIHYGSVMRMSSYCKTAICTSKVMWVNSPKYRTKLSISSSTKGLYYTSLAARYDTRAEEIILQMAVRLGI